MRVEPLLVLVLLLAGCADRAPDPVPEAAAPPPATTTPTTPDAQAEAEVASDATATAAAPSTPATALALEGEGLRVFILSSGSARPIPFGTAKTQTLDMLGAVLGGPPSDLGENIDCGATRASWPDGLTAWFVQDEFVGWSVASADAAVSTVDGLSVGDTRTELENGGTVVEVMPSSLGTEFTAGGVAGLLESPEPDARVTHLWAGATCIAR